MATTTWVKRPASTADPQRQTRHRTAGLVLALVGVMAVTAATIGNIAIGASASGDALAGARNLAWTFGLNTLGLGIVKLGIAVVLVGILVRLWHRVDSVKAALTLLRPATPADAVEVRGRIDTEFGRAIATDDTPPPLRVHRMASTLWLPMLAMGAMALAAGFVVSLAWAAGDPTTSGGRAAGAWAQGLSFLGEGLILSGISFLLGTILAGLRAGGGEVQASLGVTVKTLEMPASAKAFIGLMALGMMLAIGQFVLYLVAIGSADDPRSFAAWAAWLGPFREIALGVLLAGIVLALSTIARVLGFQFHRIQQIATHGV